MISPEPTALIWLISLSSAVFKIARSTTLLSIGLALIAQVSLLLSFLLPLKIVMLLGTKELPNIIKDIIQEIEFEPFVLLLCGLTLIFFLIQFFSGKLLAKLAKNNARYILAKCNKLVVFEEQETMAKTAYSRITETFSSILFSLLGITVFAYLYPDFTLVFLLTIAITISSVSLLYRYNRSIRQGFDKSFPQTIQTLGSLTFLTLFAYIVIDFLYLSPPNFLVAIVAVILSRQVIAQMQLTTRHINSLLMQKDKLSVIFLENHNLNPQPKLPSHSLWHFLSSEQSKELLIDQFTTELEFSHDNLNISWIDLGVAGCGSFLLTTDNGSRYLAKLFDLNRRSHALHEATLLFACTDEFPAPKLIKATSINNYHCNFFDLEGIALGNQYNKNQTIKTIKKTLLSAPPNLDLTEKFIRSQKTLQYRLTRTLLNSLRIAADTSPQLEILTNIETKLGLIVDILDSLPLRVTIPGIPSLPIGFRQDGSPVILHWAKWGLEPLGAGWPVVQDNFDELVQTTSNPAEEPTTEQYKIAVLASSLERCILERNLKLGVSVAGDLNESLTKFLDSDLHS